MKVRLGRQELLVDFYELTMAQGYFQNGMAGQRACFDYFFRRQPFGGGYAVFAGLEDVLGWLEGFSYGAESIDYLAGQGFDPDFLAFLADVRFTGDVWSAREGEIIFANEPVLRVEAPVIEAQLIETFLLNQLNFQSLIATKARRVVREAHGRQVAEFGLRRAQGLGGMQASRAAAIGGVAATSNVRAGFDHAMTLGGTQAHAWVQAFEDELAAFRAYAHAFPDTCTLLLDTYDTLRSGLPHAITVAGELAARGHRLRGVRLDSGDLAYLARRVRTALDDAGFPDTRIVASNQIDEWVVRSLLEQGAPIDIFGVGTSLVTGQPDAALDGVYKLSLYDGQPRLKLSEDPAKTSLPGRKNVLRYWDPGREFFADAVVLEGEAAPPRMHHPAYPDRRQLALPAETGERLVSPVLREGRRVRPPVPLEEAAAYTRGRLEQLPDDYQRLENPHIYKVGLSPEVLALRDGLARKHRQRVAEARL